MQMLLLHHCCIYKCMPTLCVGVCGVLYIVGACGVLYIVGVCGVLYIVGACGVLYIVGACGVLYIVGACGVLYIVGVCVRNPCTCQAMSPIAQLDYTLQLCPADLHCSNSGPAHRGWVHTLY